jgi:peptidoglycan/LPS O-acetylase OafA/YrhL
LCFGIVAMYLHFQAFAAHPWGDIVPQPDLLALETASLDQGDFGWHLAAHLTMLHGAISSHLLPVSEYMFLGPAWSLSLEWQFYLVAPLVLVGLQSRRGRILVALATVVGFAAYREGWLGEFFDPSFLPGAGPYFAVGIATRLLFGKLPEFKIYPLATMIIAFGICLMAHDLLPFAVWAAFIAWLRTAPAMVGADRPAGRVLDAAFNSKLAHYLGSRSYSTYLIHEPIIHAVVFVCITRFSLEQGPTLLVTLVSTIGLTLAASAVLYRYVEAPAIAFGKRLFSEQS